MRRTITQTIFLLFCSLLSSSAQKSPPPNVKISVAKILANSIAATGGPDAWHALQTVEASGSFGVTGPFRTGDFQFSYKTPDSDIFKFFMISHGQTSVGHRGGQPFFTVDAGRALGINGVSVYILEANWLALTQSEFNQHYSQIALAGLAEVDGKWAYALRFKPKEGDPQVRYYDCQSFLMVRMDLAQRLREQKDGPEFAYKVEAHFSDYRDSGGIKLPRQIKATSSSGSMTLDVNDVHTNRPLDDSVFQKK